MNAWHYFLLMICPPSTSFYRGVLAIPAYKPPCDEAWFSSNTADVTGASAGDVRENVLFHGEPISPERGLENTNSWDLWSGAHSVFSQEKRPMDDLLQGSSSANFLPPIEKDSQGHQGDARDRSLEFIGGFKENNFKEPLDQNLDLAHMIGRGGCLSVSDAKDWLADDWHPGYLQTNREHPIVAPGVIQNVTVDTLKTIIKEQRLLFLQRLNQALADFSRAGKISSDTKLVDLPMIANFVLKSPFDGKETHAHWVLTNQMKPVPPGALLKSFASLVTLLTHYHFNLWKCVEKHEEYFEKIHSQLMNWLHNQLFGPSTDFPILGVVSPAQSLAKKARPITVLLSKFFQQPDYFGSSVKFGKILLDYWFNTYYELVLSSFFLDKHGLRKKLDLASTKINFQHLIYSIEESDT